MELYALKMGLLMDTPLSLSTLTTLKSAIWSFFIIGKSKSTLNKISKQYTFLQRLRLCQVKDGKENCKYHKKALDVFWHLRSVYLWILCLTGLAHLLMLLRILPEGIWEKYLYVKWFGVDAVAMVFHFIMTTEQKIRQKRNCMVTMQAI